MSAHIQDLFDRSIKVTGGEANKPHGRFPSMRPILFVCFALFVFTMFSHTILARNSAAQGEDAVASYLVKETGRPDILQAKEIDKPLSPASLTKIMTCMLAIESGRMDEVVSIPLEATQVEPTKAGFKPGEHVRLRDLVRAAMVNSSNDAAFAIGIYLGGSIDSFVGTMNARARGLGMNHTWFTNPAGYDRGIYAGNRSTARDLMLLTERAVRYPEFNAIAKLDKVVFSELTTGKIYNLRTHNKLLDRYPYTVGIKTGYTSIAGPCLIARALRDGKDMLVIMLGARTDRWSLASAMFDSGFGIEPAKAVQFAESAPESFDKGVVAASAVPATRVLAERARTLKALKRKVDRQTKSAKVEEIRGISRRGRSVSKSSISSKDRVALKSRGKASQNRKMALKGGKKVKVRKEMVVKARQHSLKNKTVLKRAKKSAGGKVVALKSRNKTSQAVRTARKGSARRATAAVKKEKRSTGKKEVLSLSKKSHRSPNG